ncbi:multidrug resistance-type transporter protein, partial [Dactylonectria macrodidyma]
MGRVMHHRPESDSELVSVETQVPDPGSQGNEKKKLRPERTATFGDYLRIFKYASKWDFLAYAAGFLAAIGSGVTTPLMNVLFGALVCRISTLHTRLGFLRRNSLLVFALFLARFVLGSIHKFAFRMIGIRLSAAIRLHYLKHLLGQSVHVLDSLPPGYAVGTITSTSNTLQIGISEKLGTLVEYTALIVAAFVVSFTWNWELTLVTLSGIVAIMLAVGMLAPLTVKGQARQGMAENEAASIASEALTSIRMVMACGAERPTAEKYRVFVEEAQKEARHLSPITSTQFAITASLIDPPPPIWFFGVFGTVGLTFWYGIRAFTKGRLDNMGVITVVLLSIMIIFFSLSRISAPLLAIGKASLAACEFFSVIDAPLPEKGSLKEPQMSATDDIVFDKVTFAYPSRPHVKILDDLNLRIEAGKITAIVGPSGSGKSTIIGLIERWYTLKKQHVITEVVEHEKKKKKNGNDDDDNESRGLELKVIGDPVALEGTVSTSGHSLDEVDLKWWRSQIGLVQQEPFLFNETIYRNVARGLVGSQWEGESEERKRELVKEACKESFANEFIDKLPEGYDTNVGDSGAKLSGGQRQRIAIARSIVRKPQILLLDEATSAIDVRGERIVQVALDKVAQNRTTIIIAHRLSTIKNADRIVVLKKGQVIESGTHESLIAMDGGVYAGLVHAQALSLDDQTKAVDHSVEEGDVDSMNHEMTRAKSQCGDMDLEADLNEDKADRSFLKSFGQFFIESKTYWYMMILSVIFAAAAGTAQPLYAWLFGKSIDLFKYQNLPSKLMVETEFISGMWAVFAAAAGIAYFFTFTASAYVASFIRAKYQEQYFEAILFQRAAYFDQDGHSHGTLASRLKDDPMKLEELMGANMAMVYVSIFNVIAGTIMALVYGWKLALVSMVVIMPVCLFSGYCRFRYEAQFEKMNDEVFADSSHFASEAIGAFRTVTSLTLEDSVYTRFERLCEGHVDSAFKKARWASIVLGFSEAATLGCQALIFYYGGKLLADGEMSVMAFFVCLMALMNAAEGFGQSLSFGPNAAQATAASNRILNVRESRRVEQHGEDDNIYSIEGGTKIELRNVTFTYPGRSTPVLNALSMTIEQGQFAALVGASGCGKTTVISLLERFYEPDQGRILCNGRDIAEMNIYAYRRQLALVAQEATLFQGTIRDNILLGIDPTSITQDELHTVCRDASIHDFIVSLPEGYNTNIGSRGVSLSGGQKQRISIARALIRRPQILLLDEATSSLDSESEKLVQSAFERAAKGRTTVVVAHRLATVQNADVIFVFGEGGHLLEKGNHAQLLNKRGVYYHMVGRHTID